MEALLRDGIRHQLWTQHLPGELKLCQRLQVSRTTLRAALATLTRERWLRSSQGQRREIVQTRRPRRTPDRTGPVVLLTGAPLDSMVGIMMYLIDDLRDQLAKGGFEFEVHASRQWLGRRPDAALERLARARRPVAWVLVSCPLAVQRWFMNSGLPCVLAGSCHPGVMLPTVEVDFQSLGQHAIWQFANRGHRKVALLVPALGMAGEVKIVNGAQAAARTARGLDLQIVEHDGTPSSVKRRLETLFERNRPTGLLVAGAPYLVTVMTMLAGAGIRVPADVSVICRDSEPFLDYVLPPLTRYAVNPMDFARRLSRTAIALAQGGSAPVRHQMLEPKFMVGETLRHLSLKQTSDG